MRELCPFSSDDKHSILKHYKSRFEHLNIDCSGKAVLVIRADLWMPADVSVYATIQYYLKDTSQPVNIGQMIADRPYPNKNIISISKRFGRRKTQKGIPLVFDSLDELRKIERIEIVWEIKDFDETVIIDYPVSFENPRQDCIYTLWSYDDTIVSNNKNKSSLTIKRVFDGKLENAFTQSIYDDFYFLTLCNDKLTIIEELHNPNSQFRINFDSLETQPAPIVNAGLRNVAKNICSTANHVESVYFYHADLSLNDYTS